MTTREEFLKQMWPHALAASQATGLDPRIVMAQAAVESNWGNAAPNNNYFGQKDFSGNGASLPTEEVIDGQRVKVNQPFAKYDSPEQSFGAYAQNISTHPAYTKLRQTSGYGPQIMELGKSGYATAPNYASVIDQTARDLQVPADVKPSILPMQVAGVGAGGNGVIAPTPQAPDPRTAGDADLAGYSTSQPGTSASDRLAGILRQQQMAGLNSQAAGLLASANPQFQPQQMIPPAPMLQAHRPQPIALPLVKGLLG